MASDSVTRPVNGNYGSQNSYGSGDQQLSSQAFTSSAGAPPSNIPGAEASQAPVTSSAASVEGTSSVPKDEVGWYFVEQYYTTLSKNPEKLHVGIFAPECILQAAYVNLAVLQQTITVRIWRRSRKGFRLGGTTCKY